MTEFRNTPPRPAIYERASEELLDDLCIALRNVAVWEYAIATDSRAQAFLREAVLIAAELEKRHIEIGIRLDRLSQETGWLMGELLADCRQFPSVVPMVRELDGIRRHLRCRFCRTAEHPSEDSRYSACDGCLGKLIDSFQSLKPLQSAVLFRTYNSDWRCEHADGDTVLISFNHYEEGFLGPGECRECLKVALAKRRRA